MLVGEKVYLTPIDIENAETARRWINDPEFKRCLITGHVPVSREQERKWYEHMDASEKDHVFEIHVREDGRYIGNCGVHDIDMLHRHCEVGINIGEVSEQGKGYGSDALITATRFAFHTLGMHTVIICHMDGNERGAHLYPKLGFVPAGRLRQHDYIRGEFRDLVLLDMTCSEFDERYGASE